MKRRHAIVAGLVVGVLASAGVMAAAAGKAPVRGRVRPVDPALAPDNGAGELLIAVVGGVFPSRNEAEAANETLGFGDLQGYYVVPVAVPGVPPAGRRAGRLRARQRVPHRGGRQASRTCRVVQRRDDPARGCGASGRVRGSRPGGDPDGTGPLLGPVAESLP
jgi:hypothetical protein